MGPLETADLIGLDTVMRSLDVLYESFHDPKYRCCPLLRKLVHAGHLGRKTGRGFHIYPGVQEPPRASGAPNPEHEMTRLTPVDRARAEETT
jgi:3-hydroxyacyl-CoA dehydrogenase